MRDPDKLHLLFLICAFFLLGSIGLIAQTVLVREQLVLFYGNEIAIGVIFAAWLVGIVFGAFVASFVIERLSKEFLQNAFLSLFILMSIILPVQVYLTRIARAWLDISIGQAIPFKWVFILSLVLNIPFSFIIGLTFPLACKILIVIRGSNPAVQIGWVYVVEALGSLAAGIIFTFYLVGQFHSFKIIAFINIPVLVVIFFLSSFIKGIFVTRILRFFITLLLIINLGGIFRWADLVNDISLAKRWETFSQTELIEVRDSKYEHLCISRQEDQYNLFGNNQYISTFPDPWVFESVAHFFLSMHPNPKEILLVGGGVEGLLRPILKHPIQRLDYVQLDPEVIDLVVKYLPQEDRRLIKDGIDPRLHIHYLDGRYFIKRTTNKFDMVILNLPDPSTAMINRYYTREFFKEVKNILKTNGVVITQISSTVNYLSPTISQYIGSLYDTLKSVFPYIRAIPGERACFFVSLQPEIITFDITELDKRFKSRQIISDYFISPSSYELYLQFPHIKWFEERLAQREKSYLNTDLKPITYWFNLLFWDTITSRFGSEPSGFFLSLSKLTVGWLIGILGLVMLFRVIYLKLTPQRYFVQQRFNTLFAVFSLGLTGLTLELILIFSFQNIYGYIYQMVGLIVALFMFGLALGSIVANKIIIKYQLNWQIALATINAVSFLFAIFLPYLVKLASFLGICEFIFGGLIIISGVLIGLVYPVASNLYINLGGKPGQTASLIDSADHLGATIGALLTGVLFIPLFGILQTCWLVACLNLMSFIFLVVTRPAKKFDGLMSPN